MFKKIEDLNYYELLEVSPTATSQDIHRAYERVRRVYDPNSIALYSLFSAEETAAIHQRIEEAYRTLLYEDNRRKYDAVLRGRDELPEPTPPAAKYQAPTVQPTLPLHTENRYVGADASAKQQTAPAAPETSSFSPFTAEFTGPVFKVLREQRGLTIRNIADKTKVRECYLEYIEGEQYAKLPSRAYVRGFLALYAKALGYEPERVVSDYLKHYDAALGKHK